MKKIIKNSILIITAFLIASLHCVPIYAAEIQPQGVVCEVIEGYAVKSKTVTYKVEHTTELINSTSKAQNIYAEFERSKKFSISGNLSITLIEKVVGINAETQKEDSTKIHLSVNPSVPAKTTYYVDFGYRYVKAKVQWNKINSDCSSTWSGPITSAEYSYGSYVKVYE